MMHTLGDKRYVRLSFEHPLDFVVGDFHAGPYVRTVTGEIVQSELGAFIDHCSRYVPESRYFLTEDLMGVRRGLRALCTTVGVPKTLYVDNGPGYQAHRFIFGCAEIRNRSVPQSPLPERRSRRHRAFRPYRQRSL